MSEQYWKERAERLEAVLAEVRKVIASLPDDALGIISRDHGVIGGEVFDFTHSIKDEVLDFMDKALAQKPQPEPTDERAKALAALDRLRSFTDEDYCETNHARWSDAGLARRYIERQPAQDDDDALFSAYLHGRYDQRDRQRVPEGVAEAADELERWSRSGDVGHRRATRIGKWLRQAIAKSGGQS